MKKVLRAIGGFFAKIGRWIANTAWVQPLLIVGGIFAIIFSIPYIKNWVKSWGEEEEVDEDLEYYKNRAVSCEGAEDGNSKADQLLTYLETWESDAEAKTKLINTYGEKFFFSFVKDGCSYCSECADGFRSLSSNFSAWGLDKDEQGNKLPGFKLHTMRLDEQNDDEEYLAKMVIDNHQDLFDEIVAGFAEWGDYPLLKNITSSQSNSLITSIQQLQQAVNSNGEGAETPTTFFIDLTEAANDREVNVHGVTAVFFNYTTYIDGNTPYEKGTFLKECWTYQNLFDINTFLNK